MRRNLRNIEKTINKNYSSIADYQIKQQSKLDRINAITDDIYNMLEKLHSYPINGSCLLHGKLLLKLVNIECSIIDIHCKIQDSYSLQLHYLLNQGIEVTSL